MASRTATAANAAGIFADMTLDGPEIGTLVAVIDRARNLPNRRTMGKQDPYCAMRLGKEARKTDTDRRGGQTPKWDQELRFTVHESPDYYKLKCSVFNDDKKTDLIGESWVDLKEVVIPGGGQNDLWHQLLFKGKYAGEIRMELTYYDTRPKDEAVLEKRRDKTRHGSLNTAPSSEAGSSRQLGPREVKRRPLPASPAGSSPSHNPLREPPPPAHPPPQTYEQAIIPRKQLPPAPFENAISTYSAPQYHESHSAPEVSAYEDFNSQPQDYGYDDLEPYEEPIPDVYANNQPFDHRSFDGTPPHSQKISSFQQPWEEDQRVTLDDNPSQQRSSPNSIPSSVQPTDPRTTSAFKRYSTSPIKNTSFRDSPLRQSISHHEIPNGLGCDLEQEDLPPPPPVHRQVSGSPTSTLAGSTALTRVYPSSPLEARSPLQTIERTYEPYRSLPTTQSQEITRSPLQPRADQMEDQFRNSTGSYVPHGNGPARPAVRSSSYDALGSDNGPRFHLNSFQAQSHGHHGPDERSIPRPPPRSSTCDERNVYTSTPPIFRPRAISPNAPRHELARRPVSPSPTSGGYGSLRGTPFGPDAYEAINSVRSSPASTQGPSSAETMEPTRKSEGEVPRDLDPIIGNDGREIDPTDHLPSDTWAPEPERKNRKPEVVIRFKAKQDSPRTPASSSAAARPQSYAGYSSSPASMHSDYPSPRSGRNRLQKQAPNRPLPVQPYQHANSSPAVPQQVTPTRPLPTQPFQHANSSPSVPTAHRHQTYSTAPRTDPFRPALSEYSINSDDVYRSSPHQSPYDNITLPPVPRKIPLQAHDHYQDHSRSGSYDTLAAELNSIDIGPSRGGRTGLRSSRAYGY